MPIVRLYLFVPTCLHMPIPWHDDICMCVRILNSIIPVPVCGASRCARHARKSLATSYCLASINPDIRVRMWSNHAATVAKYLIMKVFTIMLTSCVGKFMKLYIEHGCLYKYMCTHTYLRVYVYVYVYVYIYICICIYVCIHKVQICLFIACIRGRTLNTCLYSRAPILFTANTFVLTNGIRLFRACVRRQAPRTRSSLRRATAKCADLYFFLQASP
jgi:hypothetical protein